MYATAETYLLKPGIFLAIKGLAGQQKGSWLGHYLKLKKH